MAAGLQLAVLVCMVAACYGLWDQSQWTHADQDRLASIGHRSKLIEAVLRSGGIADPEELLRENNAAKYMAPKLRWILDAVQTLSKDSDKFAAAFRESYLAKKRGGAQKVAALGALTAQQEKDNVCHNDWAEYELKLIGFICQIIHIDIVCDIVPEFDPAWWFISMFDSSFKPPYGLLEGALHWMGSGDECAGVEATFNRSAKQHTFKGLYCTITVASAESNPNNLTLGEFLLLGQCIPDTCRHNPSLVAEGTLTSILTGAIGVQAANFYCGRGPLDFGSDWRALVAAVILLSFILLCFVATIYDTLILPSRENHYETATHSYINNAFAADGDPIYSGLVTDRDPDVELRKLNIKPTKDQLLHRYHSTGEELPKVDNVWVTEQQINGNGINPSNGDLPDGHYEHLQPGSGNGDQMVMRTLPDVPQVSPSTILSQTSRTSELTVEDWYHMRWKKMHFFESEIQKSAEESRMAEVGTCGRLLLAFSMYRNVPLIAWNRDSPDKIKLLNCLRFVCLAWILFGNTYLLGIIKTSVWTTANLPAQALRLLEKWHFCIITGTFFAVDAFLVVSGVSSVYSFLRLLKNVNGKLSAKTIFMYVFSRYWRLTPMYMLYMLIVVCLYQYSSDGPIWPAVIPELEACKQNWWTNILYINNLVNTDNQCLPHTWYLAVDFQLFLVGSIVLVFFYIKPMVAYVSIFLLFCTHITCTATLYYRWLTDENGKDFNAYFNDFFIKPYTRVGPYMVGIVTGYIMYETEGSMPFKGRVKNAIFAVCGWCIALVLIVAIMFGYYEERKPDGKEFSDVVNTLYETCTVFWSVGVAWIIYACSAGYGGFIGALLTWDGWSILSRLSLSAFLVHPTFLLRYMYSRISIVYISEYLMFYIFLGHLIISYVIGFVLSFLFELPCTGVKDVLFKTFLLKKETAPSTGSPTAPTEIPVKNNHRLSFSLQRQISRSSAPEMSKL